MSSYIEYLDSDYRISGSTSEFTYEIKPNDKYDRVIVLLASIPKTYYLIQSPYNTVIFTENNTPRTITIPEGNYSNSQFITGLTALLNTGSLVYTIAYSPYTTKITITVTGGTLNNITFPSSSSLYRQLGYAYKSINLVTNNTITSPNVTIFQVTNQIYIRSNIHIPQGSVVGADILESINASNQPIMSAVDYQCTTDIHLTARIYNPGRTNPYFNITDSDGFNLDLNNIPITIKLLFFNADDSLQVLKNKALLDNLASMVEPDESNLINRNKPINKPITNDKS